MHRWTAYEDARLVMLVGRLHVSEVARELGLSVWQVHYRMDKLGLKSDPEKIEKAKRAQSQMRDHARLHEDVSDYEVSLRQMQKDRLRVVALPPEPDESPPPAE